MNLLDAFAVIRNNIGCISSINLTGSNVQLMNCMSNLDYSNICSLVESTTLVGSPQCTLVKVFNA